MSDSNTVHSEYVSPKTKILKFLHSTSYVVISMLGLTVLLIITFARSGDKNELPPQFIQAQEQIAVNEKTGSLEFPPSLNPTFPSLAHVGCGIRLFYTTKPTHTFNPNNSYYLAFTRGNTNIFQDINGDNLPDYLYALNNVNGGSPAVWEHAACVYINNGNGWNKVYECLALHTIRLETSETLRADYYGDCAGSN